MSTPLLSYFMISETGGNLSVLIITEPEKDWQTFGTWYSIYKNLPDARVAIVCQRNKKTPFEFFQWTKRLNIPCIKKDPFDEKSEYVNWLSAIESAIKSKVIGNQILVVKPLTMALSVLDSKVLDRFNQPFSWIDENGCFLNQPDIPSLLDQYYLNGTKGIVELKDKLFFQAKEEENLCCLVTYDKGCGKWINTSKGCPFSSAAALVSSEMTVNEYRIIEFWKKMVPLFDATI